MAVTRGVEISLEKQQRSSGLLETSITNLLDTFPESPTEGVVSNELLKFDHCDKYDIGKHEFNSELKKHISIATHSNYNSEDNGTQFKSIFNLNSGIEEENVSSTESKDVSGSNTYYENQKNPSIHSTSLSESLSYDVSISSAKKKIGASSNAFMEHLRGAANRRKNQVIRARDSLVAKQEGMEITARMGKNETVLASFTKIEKSLHLKIPKNNNERQKIPMLQRPFPSRAGMIGISKVKRRKTTTPVSPLLGRRRPRKFTIKSLQKSSPFREKQGLEKSESLRFNNPLPLPKRSSPKKLHVSSFRARPIPSGVSAKSGQIGIQKVKKRPVTVAVSPLLGNRRTQPRYNLRNSDSKSLASSHASSLTLVGLTLLSPETKKLESSDIEVQNLKKCITPKVRSRVSPTFVPHSSKRAKERAIFDRRRMANERRNSLLMVKGIKSEICSQQKQLSKIRLSLA